MNLSLELRKPSLASKLTEILNLRCLVELLLNSYKLSNFIGDMDEPVN